MFRCLLPTLSPVLPKVKELVENGSIGNVINVQIRFAQPPRDLDYNRENLPWRVQADIAGGGYFYDLAPHQIDLLQDMFGCILEANGYKSNRGGLYPAEDTLSACFQFDNGLVGSGSWCFVAHDSAREDRIEIIGDKGMICFLSSPTNLSDCIPNADAKKSVSVTRNMYNSLLSKRW